MAEPAPKRRRISTTTSVPENAGDALSTTRSQPTTPTRPSYLSPTKASLARSHPALFARSPGRSGRGKTLREELLGSARANQAISQAMERSTSEVQPQDLPSNPAQSIEDAWNQRNSLSAAVTNAFAASRPILSQSRSPLRPRQPSVTTIARTARAGTDDDDLAAIISPKLVTRTSRSVSQNAREASDELELPPTPVELGLHPAPEKPRGLWSSSPRSSRNRRPLQESSVKSSPLKPRDRSPRPWAVASGIPVPAKTVEVAAEVPESEVEEDTIPLVPTAITEKQIERKFLQAQLSELKLDVHRLETILDYTSKRNIAPLTSPDLEFIAKCAKSSKPDTAQDDALILPDPLQLPPNPFPHLTLFAPGKLNLHTQTTSRLLRTPSASRILQIHTLSLTAPSPWPAHIFGSVLEVHVDPKESRIEKVHVLKWRPPSTPQHAALKHWATKRLASPLHQHDPTSLIWAMGLYFDACITRARTLAALDTQYNQTPPAATDLDLIRYLTQSSLKITISSTKQRRQGRTLLLTWAIHLTWTGDAKSRVDMDSYGFPRKADGLVREVFRGLKGRFGVERAVEGVVGVITGI